MKRWKKTLLISFVVLAVIACVGPFLVPVPPLEETVTESELADPDSKFIEVNDVTIHYKEQGNGETTFILLHGFGASAFSWREVMDDFAARGRVIAYDRPAFGLTERPMPETWKTNPYSMDANIELLRGLMDALGIEKAVLVGNSAGGAVSVAFALRYPERMDALVLVDPGLGGGRGPQFPDWVLPLMRTPQARHIGPLLVRDIAVSGDETILRAWSDPSKVTDEIFEGYHKPLQANNWDRGLYELTFAPAHSELRPLLPNLKTPTFIIGGEDDLIIRPWYFEAIAPEIPGAQLVLLPNCGHVPQEECPDVFMQEIIQFLESVVE
ncbi:MAG: alpha/beta hydrolase [Anaerolineaceae bacterium]|nr:MAG: alpha/beta hydrolase [Anaerolineaceae bacterium]